MMGKSIKWILHHLPKINKVFKECPITQELINQCIFIIPENQNPHNLTIMTNIL